jgi:cytidyltransferase-like protein
MSVESVMRARPRLSKVVTTGDAIEIARRMRVDARRLVVTSGVFDLLHVGHVRLLTTARELGDALMVVAITDRAVRWTKGPGRPIVVESQRIEILCGLAAVDHVLLCDDINTDDLVMALDPGNRRPRWRRASWSSTRRRRPPPAFSTACVRRWARRRPRVTEPRTRRRRRTWSPAPAPGRRHSTARGWASPGRRSER